MGLFKKQSSNRQHDAEVDSDEPQSLPEGACFRWYFFSVGFAMGHQIYTSICKYDEFQIVGGGRGLSPGKIGVRYYTGTRQDKPEGQFSGSELESGGEKKAVATVSEAHSALGCGNDQQAVIAILSDSRFDNLNTGFRDYLNQKYIEVGALPVVRLLYTDSGEDAKRLLALLEFKEENTPTLAWNKPADFFAPDPHSQQEERSEVAFSCPNCTQHLAVHESYRGEKVPCPTCAEQVFVPSVDAPPVTVPPPVPGAPSPPLVPPPLPPSATHPANDEQLRGAYYNLKLRRSRHLAIGLSVAGLGLLIHYLAFPLAYTGVFEERRYVGNLVYSDSRNTLTLYFLFSTAVYCIGLGFVALAKGRSQFWGGIGLTSLLVLAPLGIIIAPVGQILAAVLMLVLKDNDKLRLVEIERRAANEVSKESLNSGRF